MPRDGSVFALTLVAACIAVASAAFSILTPKPIAPTPGPRSISSVPANSPALDLAWLHRRQESYLVNSYVGLHNTIASVSLAVGGLAAASLISIPVELEESGTVLRVLWLVSLLAVFVAYAGATTGAVALPPRVPALVDLVAPLTIAVTEFVMFGILARQATGLASGNALIAAWYFAYSAFAVFAAISVLRVRQLTQREEYAGDELREVIGAFRSRLGRDALGATSGLVAGTAGGILHLTLQSVPTAIDFAIAGFIAVGILGGLSSHMYTSRDFSRLLAAED